jgi:hypothetical protein
VSGDALGQQRSAGVEFRVSTALDKDAAKVGGAVALAALAEGGRLNDDADHLFGASFRSARYVVAYFNSLRMNSALRRIAKPSSSAASRS